MQNGRLERVNLSDIVPGDNPRKDFGDIDALAAAIEATGGEPVNPIVVVRDGGVCRLMDGERRWRALRSLHGEGGTATALVFDSYDAAEATMAMVATDSKKGLSEQEAARGFQRMLMLDVPTERVAKALRRPKSDIEKARLVAESAGEQTTLDQMIAAADFEGEDRLAALAEGPDRWAAKAEGIRRRRETEAARLAMLAELDRLGVRVEEGKPDGYGYGKMVDSPDEVGAYVEEHAGEDVVAYPNAYYVGRYNLTTPKQQEAETEEQRAKRELYERRDAALAALSAALLRWLACGEGSFYGVKGVLGAMRAEGHDYYRDRLRERLEGLGVGGDAAADAVSGQASVYEALRFVASNNWEWWRWVHRLLPVAEMDGFQPSDEDQWLLAQAEATRAEYESDDAEGGEGE